MDTCHEKSLTFRAALYRGLQLTNKKMGQKNGMP